MNRKNFIQNTLLAGTGVISPSILSAQESNDNGNDENKFNCNYAIHEGMFKNHGGDDFTDQIKFANGKGFRAIEDNDMM
jgi:hydroxypyruvate isomerase